MKKMRVLDYQWHIGHQYELLKIPTIEWEWLLNYRRRAVDIRLRGGDIEKMFRSVTNYVPGRYSAVVLHLDQECLHPQAWMSGKGSVYRELNREIQDVPKIVIMHGTPHFAEAPAPYNDKIWLTTRLRQVVGHNKLIVNSMEAVEQWGAGQAIIHGIDVKEWYDLPKEPRVVTVLSKAGMSNYYGRAFLKEIKDKLSDMGIKLCHIGVDYVPASWDDYRKFLGSSLLYLNPTRESPMPRARTEAMLSGCCVLTTPNHDAKSFIKNGENGFILSDDCASVASLIDDLLRSPDTAKKIGMRGKIIAQQLFSWGRFRSDWETLLQHL